MSKVNWWKTAGTVCVLCATTAIALPAQTFTSLLSFDNTNGAYPNAALIQATDGNLYGTAEGGGAHGYGTVFKIAPSGTLTTLYSFCSQAFCPDGSQPFAALVQATDGNFYGTTFDGGANLGDSGGAGTVFKITASGTLTTLYNFCSQSGCTDGYWSRASLVQGTDGSLYGATTAGGSSSSCHNDAGASIGCGTVFKITLSGLLTTLHSFNLTDGGAPSAALVLGTDGNFYGTTREGGANNLCYGDYGCGTVFKMTSSGRLTTVYSFCHQANCTDGQYPQAVLIQGTDGDLYGTTEQGGTYGVGTVFKITSNGVLTTVHSFDGTDGEEPNGLVHATDGNFYGTTFYGGSYGGGVWGTIFKITSNGALTTLHSFDNSDGSGSAAALVQDTNGRLYGTTSGGGSSGACFTGCGTVFSLPVSALSLGMHFDFDGYGTGTDYTVWRPSNGTWYVLPTNGGTSITKPWGESGDIVVPGDYDGDGKTDYAVWQPLNGTWYVILSSTGKSISYAWGESTDVPLPGDYDGDGKTDYAVWRPSNGTFYVVLSSTGKSTSKQWGVSTDLPVLGDFDGDGKTDYAVWRPSNGTWYVVLSSTGKSTSYTWGESTDIPVTGDYDGDGKTDYAVWRPSNGTFYVVLSSTGKSTSKQWGESGDTPVPRDYDGDNKTDYAVWRPSNATWYVVDSSTGTTTAVQWGLSTDVPVTKPTGE